MSTDYGAMVDERIAIDEACAERDAKIDKLTAELEAVRSDADRWESKAHQSAEAWSETCTYGERIEAELEAMRAKMESITEDCDDYSEAHDKAITRVERAEAEVSQILEALGPEAATVHDTSFENAMHTAEDYAAACEALPERFEGDDAFTLAGAVRALGRAEAERDEARRAIGASRRVQE